MSCAEALAEARDVGLAAEDDAGDERELADQRFQVLGAHGAGGAKASEHAEDVEAAVVADRDRALHRVDDQAEVLDLLAGAHLLVGVAAQAEPLEDADRGVHVALALRLGVGDADHVVDVHAGFEAKACEELDELAGEAAAEGRGDLDAERYTAAASKWWVADAGGATSLVESEPRGRGRAGAAPCRVAARVAYPAAVADVGAERYRREELAQIRRAAEAVRVLAEERHGVVDAGHAEAPDREATVEAGLGEVDDGTHRVGRVGADELAVVAGADDCVERTARRASGERPDAGPERVDLVHLLEVLDEGGPLVPDAAAVRDDGAWERR